MTSGQKHLLWFVLPLTIGGAMFAVAPAYNAPEWMVAVAAFSLMTATVYLCSVAFAWMDRRQNHGHVAAAILALSVVPVAVELLFGAPIGALGFGFVPLAAFIYWKGRLNRVAEELEAGRKPKPVLRWDVHPAVMFVVIAAVIFGGIALLALAGPQGLIVAVTAAALLFGLISKLRGKRDAQ